MTVLHPIRAPSVPNMLRLAPSLYGATLFLSALLLFAVQPMFTKMVLPRLGGAPTVWSVAMVFFQAALLGGYAYAHLLVRRMPPGLGALVHLGVLAAAAATLPIAIAQGFGTPPTTVIAPWLIALFAASIGLPFVALAASAPLLQGWFAASGHAQARNPYVLYAASNLGSFAALIAYPFAIEPFLTLREQAELWAVGFAALALLVAAASLLVARRLRFEARNASAVAVPATDRLIWAALAAIPVGLVIAVTSYITTDIASAPFLWVLPLAFYLLTFVAVFRDPPWLRQETIAGLVPFPIAILAISLLSGERQFWLVAVGINLAAFVLLAMLCHGELYRRRPAPALLTEFYLWMSLGGVVGGVFAALVAPQIFTLVYEYPILIIAAVLVLPGMFASDRKRILTEAGPVLGFAMLAVLVRSLLDIRLPGSAAYGFQIMLVGLAAIMLLQRRRPQRFLALVVLGFVLTGLWQPGFNRIDAVRSFFGVHQIIETADGRFRLLYHGTTVHGAERIADTAVGVAPEPLTYYYRGGPISESIEAMRAARGALPQVAIVGLGSGTLSCYRRSGEQWTFFEIDPAVAQIARDPRLFTYVSACAPDLPVVLGDARLTLAASRHRYDLIILDAFSSDVVPVHLLTREAIDGYLARLEDGGAVVLHLSNRYMELGGVIAAVAAAQGLVAVFKDDDRPLTVPLDYKANASVAVLARRRTDLGELPDRPGWHEVKPVPDIRIWTDDYSNVLGAILRKRFGP
ncbi:MAG TPA: fused MFS/spermidine synthase [Xanthobacteraceae bacterium]|jgi:spermidine synthase